MSLVEKSARGGAARCCFGPVSKLNQITQDQEERIVEEGPQQFWIMVGQILDNIKGLSGPTNHLKQSGLRDEGIAFARLGRNLGQGAGISGPLRPVDAAKAAWVRYRALQRTPEAERDGEQLSWEAAFLSSMKQMADLLVADNPLPVLARLLSWAEADDLLQAVRLWWAAQQAGDPAEIKRTAFALGDALQALLLQARL